MKKIADLIEATSIATADLLEIETVGAATRKAKKINVLALTTESVSANHTIDGREDSQIVLMTTGATDKTVALPNSATDDVEIGDLFRVLKVDAGAGKATINRQGTDTIDGGSTGVPLYSEGNYALIMYLGSGAYTVLGLKSNGSNANGEYILLSNGTQICQFEYDIDPVSQYDANIGTYGWSFYHGSYTWTYPAAFIVVPQYAASSEAGMGFLHTRTTTQAVLQCYSAFNSSVRKTSVIAIGQWRT